nr:putative Gag-polypeptide of LTR copia-type [Tanacetum cinerariifolium]
ASVLSLCLLKDLSCHILKVIVLGSWLVIWAVVGFFPLGLLGHIRPAKVLDLVLLGSFGGVFGAIGGGGIGSGVPPPTSDNPPVVLINNLDDGNPILVHNSDNSSSVLVLFKLLGTQNYIMWNNAMKLALQARNKYGFVDGTCLRDSFADSEVLCAQWDRCNAMVLTWIMNVVFSNVYMGLVYSENDASVWNDLNETYDKVDGSMVYVTLPDGAWTEYVSGGVTLLSISSTKHKE